jgi:hypothetical protein
LKKVLGPSKHHLLEVNNQALMKGNVLVQEKLGFTG